jgi:hypothetical protein
MKPLISFIFLWVAVANPTYCQDLIIFTNGDVLEVKIVEQTESIVRFKRSNNLEGKTYIVKSSVIKEIIFEKDRKEVAPSKTLDKVQYFEGEESAVLAEETTIQIKRSLQSNEEQSNEQKLTLGNHTLGGKRIGKEQFRSLLKQNPYAYDKYKEGNTMIKAGTGVTILGVLWLVYEITDFKVEQRNINRADLVARDFLSESGKLVLSGLVITSGITLVIMGKSEKSAALKRYNDGLGTTFQVEWGGDGLGIVMHF